MDMKLISATCSRLVSRPHFLQLTMAASSKDARSGVAHYKVLRDIFYSEELKIQAERCKTMSNHYR